MEAGAFELDRRLSAGPSEWSDASDEYEAALVGERPNSASDTSKALRRLLLGMIEQPEQSGLELGPDSCLRTMNNYSGVSTEDVESSAATSAASSAASSSTTAAATSGSISSSGSGGGSGGSGGGSSSEESFDLGRLLESVSTHKERSAPPSLPAALLSGLRENTRLHRYQEEGIAWMRHKE